MVNTKKTFKAVLEGTISGALGIALLFNSVNLNVKATNSAPSPTAFAEASAFAKDTDYGLETDDIVQKVYFGKNRDSEQGWYIVGYDETTGGLVLFCDPNQPIALGQVFNNSASGYQYEGYSVNANYYGGSDIRKKLQELEKDTSLFTTAEQSLMKETTIYTYDSKNYTVDTTQDKLYLGRSTTGNREITVGANKNVSPAQGNAGVNNGLIISNECLAAISSGNSIEFWLCSPGTETNRALRAKIGDAAYGSEVASKYECVPAFALNTSSVLFASSAKPALYNSTLSDGVYFRFKDTASKIDATTTKSGNELTITKGDKNVYLYIQGKDGEEDWVYSKWINNIETLTTNDIHAGLTSFSNCKAWLEISEDNITYAEELNLSDISTIKLVKIVPSPTAFAEPNAFGKDTDYGLQTGKIAQKVCFGKNGNSAQCLYVAGYDETKQNLVLFCDPNQPMLTDQIFLAQNKYDGDHFNITLYEDGETYETATRVYANHYGGSDIREKLQELEEDTNVFTTAEQNLMQTTTVKTYDHNKKVLYNTTDKLYLATGDLNEENTLVKVGDSVSGEFNVDLASGLNDSPYTMAGGSFWLRTAHYENHLDALEAVPGTGVTYKSFLDHGSNCVPAFALNTSSVLFASSATPASSNSTLSDGVYLRMNNKQGESKINANVTTSGDTVTITTTPSFGTSAVAASPLDVQTEQNGDVYLYVQGKDGEEDWVYSKQINDIETLTANDIHAGLTSFNNCRAWIEASEDNITYAEELDLSNVNTIKLISKYSITIRLKDEFGKVITDAEGIALKWGKTSINDDGNGVFILNDLTDKSYKLTVIIDENISDYLAPEAPTFIITKGANESANTATLNVVVKLQRKEIEVDRVLTGIGGEAGYKYNRRTGKTKFYCSPYPGYKLDKIWKDADGKTEYVSFKTI